MQEDAATTNAIATKKTDDTMRRQRMLEALQPAFDAARPSLENVATMRSSLPRLTCVVFVAFALAACATQRPGSIGAQLLRDNETGALYVRDLSPNLAAERAGMTPGDEIIMIEGHYVRELGAPRVREMLRGDVNTPVRLTVVRGEQVLRVRIVRTELREAKEDAPKPRVETMIE